MRGAAARAATGAREQAEMVQAAILVGCAQVEVGGETPATRATQSVGQAMQVSVKEAS